MTATLDDKAGAEAGTDIAPQPSLPGARLRWLQATRLNLRVIDGGRRASRVRPIERPATPATADPVLVTWQKWSLGATLLLMAASFVLAPLRTATIVNSALTAFFAAANVFKLVLVRRAIDHHCAYSATPAEVASLRILDLPTFTILVPVYHESAVLQQLLEGIEELDYPSDRLDVKVLLEEDDDETAGALDGIALPPYISVLTIPDVGPKGKPRACNHGLTHARGDYLVIYDAEDRPEPDQLLKVLVGFSKVGKNVICLQAQLNYFNRTQNTLTRWFAAEYSMWFDQLLTGLQSFQLAIPLGGTSNHFITDRLRDLGGWNAYNVTEDADLGMRIHRHGWRTAVIDSTTYEEANSRTRNWIRQRSRWAKGYMQTYLCHMRNPVALHREIGFRAFAAFHLFFGAQTMCLLINPFYWLVTVLWFTTRAHVIEASFPAVVADIGLVGFSVGNMAFVLSVVAGCVGRRNYGDVKWALLVPFYWALMSIAAWKGFLQLFFKPYYWEKTTHGFSMYDASLAPANVRRTSAATTADAATGG